MEEFASIQVFDKLLDIPENKKCFECGSPTSNWVSVNNGIFLCFDCSGTHKSLGPQVSLIKSICMDNWTSLQLAMMQNGGNAKLHEFFSNYPTPSDAPVGYKFLTRAAFYYREKLKATSEEKPFLLEPPIPEEGVELLNRQKVEDQGDAVDKLIEFFEKTAETTVKSTKNIYYGIQEKMTDPNFKIQDEAIQLGSKAVDTAKNIAKKAEEKVKDPEFQNNVKEIGNKVAEGTIKVVTKVGEVVSDPVLHHNIKEFGNKVANKGKDVWTNRDQYLNKGASLAKKGWGGMVGFFNKIVGDEPEKIDLREDKLETVYSKDAPDLKYEVFSQENDSKVSNT